MVKFSVSPGFLELPFGEQLTLWGVRCWTADKGGPDDVEKTLEWAFRLVGASAAAGDLCAFLGLLMAAARNPLDVRAPVAPDIGDDEHLLLGAIGAAQQDRRDEMMSVLTLWLPQSGLRLVEAPLRRYADALRERALIIRRRATIAAGAANSRRADHPGRRVLH